jgi:hypothetical protein
LTTTKRAISPVGGGFSWTNAALIVLTVQQTEEQHAMTGPYDDDEDGPATGPYDDDEAEAAQRQEELEDLKSEILDDADEHQTNNEEGWPEP